MITEGAQIPEMSRTTKPSSHQLRALHLHRIENLSKVGCAIDYFLKLSTHIFFFFNNISSYWLSYMAPFPHRLGAMQRTRLV